MYRYHPSPTPPSHSLGHLAVQVYLGKVDPQLLLRPRGRHLQHPVGRVEAGDKPAGQMTAMLLSGRNNQGLQAARLSGSQYRLGDLARGRKRARVRTVLLCTAASNLTQSNPKKAPACPGNQPVSQAASQAATCPRLTHLATCGTDSKCVMRLTCSSPMAPKKMVSPPRLSSSSSSKA